MLLAHEWNAKTKQERKDELASLVGNKTNDVPDYIGLVMAGKYEGVYASDGPNFEHAIFGRDSVMVAEDLLETHQQLAYDIIHELARLQGVKTDQRSEEEPGKIHHEYRYVFFGGHRIPAHAEAVLHSLQQKWGGERTDTMVYWGTCDATPLFVRLIGAYVDIYGPAILEHTYVGRDWREHDILHSLKQAVAWVANKIEDSAWGLLEYKRLNPNGLANQAWKDSDTAYLHSDGTLANFDGGIASIELQGYAYDALEVGAELLSDSAMRRRCQTLAKSIQDQLIPLFWMEQNGFFAQGLDRDSGGNTRQIDTFTSNPASLLGSSILIDMPREVIQSYVEKVVQVIMGPDFLTPAGIRSRALSHRVMPGFADYHGSYTVWPKETYAIAKGLRRQGFIKQAQQLEKCILNTVSQSGEFYEFFYVDETDKVWLDPKEAMAVLKPASQTDRTPHEHPALPEPGQAWTISAFMCCLENLHEEKNRQLEPTEGRVLQTTT